MVDQQNPGQFPTQGGTPEGFQNIGPPQVTVRLWGMARRLGYRELRLYTHEKMTENIALYLRVGFAETGRAQEAGYDRVFMTKHLDRVE